MKKIILFIAVFLLISSTVVLAADNPSVVAKLDVEDFHVEISVREIGSYTRTILVAAPYGVELSDIISSGNPVYMEQVESDKSGKIEKRVVFSDDAEGRKYIIYAITPNGTYTSNVFSYLVEEDAIPAKNAINSASASAMYGALSGCDSSLALDMTEYNTFSESNKKKVASILHSSRPSGGFEEIADIHTAFAKAVSAVYAPLADNPSLVYSKYSKDLGIDINLLNNLNSAEKSAFNSFIKSFVFEDADSLTNNFEEAIFVAKVRGSVTAGEIQNLFMSEYKNDLGLNLQNYSKLVSPISVYTYLNSIKDAITGFEDAKTKFETKAYALYAKQSSQGSQSGGSSSGGSGYPAVSPSNPQSTPVIPDTTPTYNALYSDLGDSMWAKDSIELLTQKGIVSGDGNGKFRPADGVTRAEFVKMLVSAFGIGKGESKLLFDDVSADSWYASYIDSAVSYGIVNGISDTLFAPEKPIIRQDIAVMVTRILDYSKVSAPKIKETTPTDINSVSDYAKASVENLYKCGILNGYEDGSFKPANGAARAEVAKIVSALLTLREAVN